MGYALHILGIDTDEVERMSAKDPYMDDLMAGNPGSGMITVTHRCELSGGEEVKAREQMDLAIHPMAAYHGQHDVEMWRWEERLRDWEYALADKVNDDTGMEDTQTYISIGDQVMQRINAVEATLQLGGGTRPWSGTSTS